MDNSYYSRQEVIDLLKIGEKTYQNYLDKGILKPYKPSEESKKFYFKKDDIDSIFKPAISTKTIAIANQKGGVGKTTLTHNIGDGLASRQYKTLLIDIDPQSNLSSVVGVDRNIDPDRTIYTIFDKEINTRIAQDILHKVNDYLYIAPSHLLISGVEKLNTLDSYFKLKKFISLVYNNFDFIVIDCPPSLGTLTTNAFMATEYVLIPVEPDFYSPLGTVQLFKAINEAKEYNPILKILGAVINKKDERTSISKDITTQLKDDLKTFVFESMVNLNTKIKEAPFKHQSVLEYSKSSQGASDIRDLIGETLEKIKG
jgi:chromosome partitioning protein